MAMEKNHVGRPLKFKSVEELEKKCNEYFTHCDKVNKENGKIVKPYTLSGLASFLQVDRDTILNYRDREEYSALIKDCKAKVLAFLEENSLTNNINATMSIFQLKNNFLYSDKVEVTDNREPKRIFDFFSDRSSKID